MIAYQHPSSHSSHRKNEFSGKDILDKEERLSNDAETIEWIFGRGEVYICQFCER